MLIAIMIVSIVAVAVFVSRNTHHSKYRRLRKRERAEELAKTASDRAAEK